MRHHAFFFCIICLFILPISLWATDLTIGRIISPPVQIAVGHSTPISFWVKNINKFDADVFDLAVTIRKRGVSTPVLSFTFSKTNLPKYDSAFYTAVQTFTPTDTGTYDITVTVTYSQDIDHTNDTKTQSFVALAAPNVGMSIHQFTSFSAHQDTLSTMGIIQFTIPPKTKPCFLNVLIRRSDTSQPVWIVRNLLYIGPDFTPENPIGMFIDFRRIGLQPGQNADSVILCVSCTEVPLSNPPEPDITCEWYNVTPDKYAVGVDNIQTTALSHPEPFFLDSLPTFLPSPTLSDTVERGCTIPNLDLDSSVHHGSAAGYKGDWNACSPTAVANSMEWLERTHPELMHTGLSHREKLEEISSFCNRPVNGGTPFEDFIKAKLAFIDKYKLPIKVKFQGIWGTAENINSPDPRYGHSAEYQGAAGGEIAAVRVPKWDWLVREMQDSEDVEMSFAWYDSTGARKGGHHVTVTGTAVIDGQKQFRLKDDQKQGIAGGTRMPSVYWLTRPDGWVELVDLSKFNRTCFLETIASESFDTSVHFIQSGVDDIFQDKNALITIANNPSEIGAPVAIDLFIAIPGRYRLRLTDLMGHEITRFADEFFDTGAKRYYWEADQNGSVAAAGIYFVVIEGAGKQQVAKIIKF